MVGNNETFINSLTIPDEEWATLDIAMNDNEFDLLQNEAFEEAAGETGNLFLKREAFHRDDESIDLDFEPMFFENEINLDIHERKGCYQDFNSDSTLTNSTITTTSSSSIMSEDIMLNASHDIIVSMGESVELSTRLPSLTPSELDEKLEQSASRLKTSMERSEISRQKIMQNGSALYQTLMFSSLSIGTSGTSNVISQSSKRVGSYMSQVGGITI